jgi:hypothetical protein
MTETAVSLSGNPDSTDGLVRELEESGYPVDGSTEQFVPQPASLSVESPGFPPAELNTAQVISGSPENSSEVTRRVSAKL